MPKTTTPESAVFYLFSFDINNENGILATVVE